MQFTTGTVLGFFEAISRIPRGSGNEKAVSDYCATFAIAHGLMVKQDALNNVVIYKSATIGLEDCPPLILQCHLDMVCEKTADTRHDFLVDPIDLQVVGDYLYANNTTLGADNGIGIALVLAILSSDDVKHPPLEVVLTTREESGMEGMKALNADWFSARRMINLDSGRDGELCVGCAEGRRLRFSIPVTREATPKNSIFYTLAVRGLRGGHSGLDIDCGRANSIVILGRILNALKNVAVADISGGLVANAIPREANAIIALAPSDIARTYASIDELEATLCVEYKMSDPSLTLTLHPIESCPSESVFSAKTVCSIVTAMLLLPNGVLFINKHNPTLVETSLNIGVLTASEFEVDFLCSLRSSVSSRMSFVKAQMCMLATVLGARVDLSVGAPGWNCDPNSQLLGECVNTYVQLRGVNPTIRVAHVGLECGLMLEKIPELDIVCISCDIFDMHTPNEHVSISSVERLWEYIKTLLSQL